MWLLRYDCFNIKLWLPVWTGSKGQIGGHLFVVKIFLRINDLYNGTKIVNLPVVVVEIWFFKVSKFDLRFGQKLKVKLGSLFYKYFLTINNLYNGSKIVNLPLVVVEIWVFLILNFHFRFGQEVKVKLGSPFVNIFWQLTIRAMEEILWIYLLWLFRYYFFQY